MKKSIYVNTSELNNCVIMVTVSKYKRNPSGGFSAKPLEQNSKFVEVDYYQRIVDSIPMFNDRLVYSYTPAGYIPTKFSCYSWGDGSYKSVREFKIIPIHEYARLSKRDNYSPEKIREELKSFINQYYIIGKTYMLGLEYTSKLEMDEKGVYITNPKTCEMRYIENFIDYIPHMVDEKDRLRLMF